MKSPFSLRLPKDMAVAREAHGSAEKNEKEMKKAKKVKNMTSKFSSFHFLFCSCFFF